MFYFVLNERASGEFYVCTAQSAIFESGEAQNRVSHTIDRCLRPFYRGI